MLYSITMLFHLEIGTKLSYAEYSFSGLHLQLCSIVFKVNSYLLSEEPLTIAKLMLKLIFSVRDLVVLQLSSNY